MDEGVLTVKATLEETLAAIESYPSFARKAEYSETYDLYGIRDNRDNDVLVRTQQALFPDEYPEDPSGIFIEVYESLESGFLRRLEAHLREAGLNVMDAEYF